MSRTVEIVGIAVVVSKRREPHAFLQRLHPAVEDIVQVARVLDVGEGIIHVAEGVLDGLLIRCERLVAPGFGLQVRRLYAPPVNIGPATSPVYDQVCAGPENRLPSAELAKPAKPVSVIRGK